MKTDEATKRYKILQFYDKYGLEATKDTFGISRRTIYRSIVKENQGNISPSNSKSAKPNNTRTPTIPKVIVITPLAN